MNLGVTAVDGEYTSKFRVGSSAKSKGGNSTTKGGSITNSSIIKDK